MAEETVAVEVAKQEETTTPVVEVTKQEEKDMAAETAVVEVTPVATPVATTTAPTATFFKVVQEEKDMATTEAVATKKEIEELAAVVAALYDKIDALAAPAETAEAPAEEAATTETAPVEDDKAKKKKVLKGVAIGLGITAGVAGVTYACYKGYQHFFSDNNKDIVLIDPVEAAEAGVEVITF